MKKTLSKVVLSVLFVGLLASSGIAQFAGEIEFLKTVGPNHVKYKYLVTGDNIRVEEVGDNGEINGIQLLKLAEKKMYALTPERKMYIETPRRRQSPDFSVEVKKTGNKKTFLGKECEEIIVINKDRDRKIVYYVTKGDYTFFLPMLEMLNRKENQAMYYQKIEGMKGYFPLYSVEYLLSTGDKVTELKALKVEPKKVDAKLFEIPSDYSKWEK